MAAAPLPSKGSCVSLRWHFNLRRDGEWAPADDDKIDIAKKKGSLQVAGCWVLLRRCAGYPLAVHPLQSRPSPRRATTPRRRACLSPT